MSSPSGGSVILDMGKLGQLPREKVVAITADNLEALNGATPETLADELAASAGRFVLSNAVNGLVHTPLLVLSADDGLAALTDALVQAIKDKGGDKVTTIHAATDHGWSDHRIFLESKIIEWLAQLH